MIEEMKEGVIELDSEFAKEIGFTSDKFQGYLWKAGDYIYISAIKSIHPEQGNLSTLLACIEEKGFNTKVPTPPPKTETILNQKGFKRTIEKADIEVWVLKQ